MLISVIGGRYDIYRAHSDDPLISRADYRNFSWNAGVVLKPTEWLDFSYRISTGFRVPSFDELYGRRPEIGKQKSLCGQI